MGEISHFLIHILRETRAAKGQTLKLGPASQPPQSGALASLPPCLAGDCRIPLLAANKSKAWGLRHPHGEGSKNHVRPCVYLWGGK